MNSKMCRKTRLTNHLIDILWAGAHNKKKKPGPARHVKGRDFIKNEYEDAFFNRIIGFRGELNYLQRAHSFKNTLAGGWFIPYRWTEELDYTKSAAYVTVLPEINDRYSFLYEVLRKALPEINFFLLTYSPNTDNFAPNFESYMFERNKFVSCAVDSLLGKFQIKGKDYQLDAFSRDVPEIPEEIRNEAYKRLYIDEVEEEIYESIVFDRLFFDVLLSGTYKKGRPTDIDVIQLNPFKQELLFIDVKEKYTHEGKVGINQDHLPFFLQMKKCFAEVDGWKFDSRYLLRLTRSATDSSFCGWYQKSIIDFFEGEDAGGNIGQNGSSAQNTKTISIDEMTKI